MDIDDQSFATTATNITWEEIEDEFDFDTGNSSESCSTVITKKTR